MNNFGQSTYAAYGSYDTGNAGYVVAASSPAGGKGAGPQGEDKSGASTQKLTPLLISQILSASQQHKDDAFTVDGFELNQISIVGTIKSVAKLSTNLTIVLQDPTGEVDVRQWLEADSVSGDQWRQGMQVRVIGHVREFQEKRSVLAFKIRPVSDQQEAVHHYHYATYVHLLHRFGPLPENAGAVVNTSHAYQAQGPAFGTSPKTPMGVKTGGAKDLHAAVLAYVRSVHGNEGASMQDIVQSLQHVAPQKDIETAVDYLQGEGHLYTTIDDAHFKAAV